MVLSEFAIPVLTSICIYGSICIIINHCIKRREFAPENQRKCVVLTEEAYNRITQRQPVSQEYPQYELERNSHEEKIPLVVTHPPPKYDEIDQMK